jgi:dipeptidyl aminopeptidase/acylaminoacyl peptidase
LILLIAVTPATPADAKKPLTYDAYAGWRSIPRNSVVISEDGQWLAYVLVPQEGDGELVVLNLKTDNDYRLPGGVRPVLTVDGKFVLFTIVPLKADVDKAKEEKKRPDEKPKNALGIMNLATGEVTTIERVKSFKVPEEAGGYVAYLLEAPLKKPGGKKGPGTDLVIRELASGKTVVMPEVTEYNWNKPGTWLAYVVSSEKPDNDGAFAWKTSDGQAAVLLKGIGHYKSFVFDEKGAQLAFLSDRDEYEVKAPSFRLYHWTAGAKAAVELASDETEGMPEGKAVSEHGPLRFSKDGGRLFFGIASAPKPKPKDAPEPLKVDIWHWKDPFLQPMQRIQAQRERNRSFGSVIHLGSKDIKIVPLASEDMPWIRPSEVAKLALGISNIPYRQFIGWDAYYYDFYLVNLDDGSRKKVLEKRHRMPEFSPGGKYLLYFNKADKNWYTYRISDGKTVNLTGKLDVQFEYEFWDYPNEPDPYGSDGWTDGDTSVLIRDRYDIWEISPDGKKARMITKGIGRRDKILFQYVRLDREETAVPIKTPIFLSATDDDTKASGVYKVTLGKDAAPVKIVMYNKRLSLVLKAKKADTYIFTLSRFEEYPNLWVSDRSFADARQISNVNPQQADYIWGKAELIQYRNADGVALPAILIKPDNFDSTKKYPLMVYIYETLANGLHNYVTPAPGTSINISRYVSNGYVVLQPDIIYDVGYPGPSAVKCVVPAVEKVLEMDFIDPDRVGIQGHSWGGYQISYLITQTNLFAAAQAGASDVNMTSGYGGIRWGSGRSRAFQYEKISCRIGKPLWEGIPLYIENSPLFWADRINTPYLTIHNDEDGAVSWYQGIQFFLALRRLGKEAYLFNYNGEGHALRNRDNQKHWTVQQDEFFDHYLLGKPKPEWMVKGVPFLERGKRDIESLFMPPNESEEKKD